MISSDPGILPSTPLDVKQVYSSSRSEALFSPFFERNPQQELLRE